MSGEKHNLGYKMGNLGDVIKHGMLAEVAEWWGGNETRPLIYADTFAGLPYAESNLHDIVTCGAIERLSGLTNTAISCVYAADKSRYLGSTLLVKRISEKHPQTPRIMASDKSEAARRGLRDAGLEVINLPNCNDGYTVLDDDVRHKHAQNANLILIDPYAGFLRDEYNNGCCRLQKIKALAQKNIWVMLFILDMWSEGKNKGGEMWKIHDNYHKFRESLPKGTAFSLRLPKGVKSRKKTYDVEVLLTSKMLASKDGKKLRDNLATFKDAAQKALFPHGDKTIEPWTP